MSTTTEDGRTMPEPGLRAQLLRIRYDLTAAQGKLTDVFSLIDALGIDDERRRESFINGPVTAETCESCGVGGGNHTHDCQALHLEIANRTGTTSDGATARLVARAHIPSQEQA